MFVEPAKSEDVIDIKESKDIKINYDISSKCYKKIPYDEFCKRNIGTEFYQILYYYKPVGLISLTARNEIGYCILPDYKRKRITKIAIELLMLKKPRKYYWALIDKNNEESMKFIQSLGFVPRGIAYGFNPS